MCIISPMKNTSFKAKTRSNYFQTLIIFSIFFTPFELKAQDSSDDLTAALGQFNQNIGESGDGPQVGQSSADGYKSFVQNELQNIFTKMSDLEKQEIEEITFAEINKKRIELSIKLCEQDQRACFLVDEYKSYKSNEDIPKEFEALKLFGQDIFSGYANEFNFFDSLPIDNEYIIKLGDELKISLFGGFDLEASMQVDLNGSIIIPNIGEYQVAGSPYSEVSSKIKNDISNKFPGTEAYISLNSVRSKQVFALGNVRSPGTYALNALNALIKPLVELS